MIQIDALHDINLKGMQKYRNVIFTLIKPYLPNIVYQTAQAKHRATSAKIKKLSVVKCSKKVTQRDEF